MDDTTRTSERSETTGEDERRISPLRMLGRLANGAELDSGVRYHAVRDGAWTALCGAKPGRRSVGWSEYPGESVTCPRCLKKMLAGNAIAEGRE